jgi:hypothetical protein
MAGAAAAGIVGGAAAASVRGSFSDGFSTAAAGYLFNEMAHDIEAKRQAIAAAAKAYVGSSNYTEASSWHGSFEGKPKCNLFVADVLEKVGIDAPESERYSLFGLWDRGSTPLLAEEWGNPNLKIPGWTIVNSGPMMPGDVMSTGMHMGIVVSYNEFTGTGQSVSASTLWQYQQKVVQNDWGFRSGQAPLIRRYVGP